ncbi:hypothetical protein NDU88_001017 [Pleurodeles waltl]|uniref:Neurotrophin-3 n=1 Tax=Pleurodeles waltl TaxID=8319 RepID=A0AAV7P4I8_PLEWA|nr:hypothetical protein NDU88_001017 [Pleurodeles waltl]
MTFIQPTSVSGKDVVGQVDMTHSQQARVLSSNTSNTVFELLPPERSESRRSRKPRQPLKRREARVAAYWSDSAKTAELRLRQWKSGAEDVRGYQHIWVRTCNRSDKQAKLYQMSIVPTQ